MWEVNLKYFKLEYICAFIHVHIKNIKELFFFEHGSTYFCFIKHINNTPYFPLWVSLKHNKNNLRPLQSNLDLQVFLQVLAIIISISDSRPIFTGLS